MTADANEPLARLVRAEVRARGLAVQAGLPCTPTPQEIAQWSCDLSYPAPFPEGLAALLRVTTVNREARIEIWTREPGTTKGRLAASLAATSRDDQTLPVRAAENTRAFLLEAPAALTPAPSRLANNGAQTTESASAPVTVQALPGPTNTDGPPALTARTPASSALSPSARLVLGLDAAELPPQGAASGGFAVMLRAGSPLHTFASSQARLQSQRPGQPSWQLSWQLSWGVRALLPISQPTLSNEAGRATLAARILAPELQLNLRSTDPLALWEAGLSLGVGLAWLRTTGLPAASFGGRRDDVVTALPLTSAEIARRMGKRLRLRAGALVGVTTQSITIRFAGTPVSGWGRPLVALFLGFDVTL